MIYWEDFDFNELPDIEAIKGNKQNYYLNSDFAVDIGYLGRTDCTECSENSDYSDCTDYLDRIDYSFL